MTKPIRITVHFLFQASVIFCVAISVATGFHPSNTLVISFMGLLGLVLFYQKRKVIVNVAFKPNMKFDITTGEGSDIEQISKQVEKELIKAIKDSSIIK